jgi:hypothetical protein
MHTRTATAVIQDTMFWDGSRSGDGPVWPTRAQPGAIYEYSVKRFGRKRMTICEHPWTPYAAPPGPNGWGDEDRFERCEQCGVHIIRMVPSLTPIYNEQSYFVEPNEVYFAKDLVPQSRTSWRRA